MNQQQIKNAIRALGFTLQPEPGFTIAAIEAAHPWNIDPRLQALAAQFGLTWNLEAPCLTAGAAETCWILEA